MSDHESEHGPAPIVVGVVSLLLAAAAVASLLTASAATPGVTATAALLLLGAGYGVAVSVVSLVRRGRSASDAVSEESAAE
ncbi:hypothetical protein [Leifsonia sp. AG29]|uniref:hypothetical protein n=1 Tax=Leifsonia sp. AG29 TaxID=2598860 RepID=UPI00131D82A9|nr:hypothetical protein [Leifsonia sp. AG29]